MPELHVGCSEGYQIPDIALMDGCIKLVCGKLSNVAA